MAKRPAERQWPKTWGNIAQIASPVVALCALIAIYIQVITIKENAGIANARQVYMSYSEAGLRYPQFVEPNLPLLKSNPLEFVRYKAYVSHMLFAYDEVFAVMDLPEWRAAFDYDLKQQMAYLCEENAPEYDAQFYAKIRKLLAEARAAECKK